MSTGSINSLRTQNTLNNNLNNLSDKLGKMSSGKRINKASDDAAGLAIASSLDSDSAVLQVANRNISDAVSAIQIADSAMSSLSDIAGRKAELSMQAANGTYSDTQRAALNNEYQALSEEDSRIKATTSFNGQNVLSGSFEVQAGSDGSVDSRIAVSSASPASTNGDISTQSSAAAALDSSTQYVASISQSRGSLGASEARLSTAASNNAQAIESIKAASSRIQDQDIAEVSSEAQAAKIKVSMATKVMSQSSTQGDITLSLINKKV